MPAFPFPIGFLHQRLQSGHVLSGCLGWGEITRITTGRDNVKALLRKNLEKIVPTVGTADLLGRRSVAAAEGKWLTLRLDPPHSNVAWKEPVTLRFPVVVWSHGTEAVIAHVLSLRLTVIAEKSDDLTKILQDEVRSALRREGLSKSLYELSWLQTTEKFLVEWETATFDVPTLKDRAVKEKKEAEGQQESVLKKVSTLLKSESLRTAWFLDETVERLAESLTSDRPQSVLMVGPGGVGKTAAFRELVRRREDFQLGATPFHETSGARLVAGQCGFGMWQERCTAIVRECSKSRAVLHLGNLVELMEVGKSEHNNTGLAGFLRTSIARGDLLCVAECTPEQIHAIERQDPQLVEAFRRVKVDEPDRERGVKILREYAKATQAELRDFTGAAVEEIDRLHRRYATYSAFPGRPIRFIENLRRDGESGTIEASEVLRNFARETGLPKVLLDPAETLDLAVTREWFATRVIGQPEAVDLVVDLLATIKAGLSRPNRPLASLLFIGPTGVGKTEMAKALAEYLFGSKERLTRFDMSEYGDPIAVQRLAGGIFGTEGLLTSKVREQPFSVILLDEFEKAHPSFLDLMLQALGEARLTDAGGRLADFRNAVIILTSNLGAESYQSGKPGFDKASGAAHDAKQHFVAEVEKFLRPEMFNRLDRLVPFAPLDEPTVRRIASREWDKVLHRDGIRFRNVQVTAGEAVVARLAETGFDPRYGARPLKRAIEREVLAPIAHEMNRYSADMALSASISLDGPRLEIDVKPRQEAGRVVHARRLGGEATGLIHRGIRVRRLHQLLEGSNLSRELENQKFQLEQAEKAIFAKQRRGKTIGGGEHLQLARLGRLREVLAEVHRQRDEAVAIDDEALLAFHRDEPLSPDLAGRLDRLGGDWERLLLLLNGEIAGDATDEILLTITGEKREWMRVLAEGYIELAKHLGFKTFALEYVRRDPPKDVLEAAIALNYPVPEEAGASVYFWKNDFLFGRNREGLQCCLKRKVVDAAKMKFNDQVVLIALLISGTGSRVRYLREGGWHQFQTTNEKKAARAEVLVEIESGAYTDYVPREEVARKGKLEPQKPVRSYFEDGKRVVDARVDQSLYWDGDLVEPLERITAAHQRHILEEMILQ